MSKQKKKEKPTLNLSELYIQIILLGKNASQNDLQF
mgnify:CR=1 FL=1